MLILSYPILSIKDTFVNMTFVTIVFLFLVALSSFIKVVLETGKNVGIIGSGKIGRILREKKFTRIGLIIVVNKWLSPNGYGNNLLSCHNLSSNLSPAPYCPVAQRVEHATVNRGVEGSNPSGTAKVDV